MLGFKGVYHPPGLPGLLKNGIGFCLFGHAFPFLCIMAVLEHLPFHHVLKRGHVGPALFLADLLAGVLVDFIRVVLV